MKRRINRRSMACLAIAMAVTATALAQATKSEQAVSFPKLEPTHAETFRLSQYPLLVRYSKDVPIKELRATINERDISHLFSPGKVHEEVVMVPLAEGQNVLTIDVDLPASESNERNRERRYTLTFRNRRELAAHVRAGSARGKLTEDRDFPDMSAALQEARKKYFMERFGMEALRQSSSAHE